MVAGYVVAGGGWFIFAIFSSQHLPNTCKCFTVKYFKKSVKDDAVQDYDIWIQNLERINVLH